MKNNDYKHMRIFYIFTITFLWLNSSLLAQNILIFNDANNPRIDLSKKFKSYKILKLENQISKISSGTNIAIDYKTNYNFILKENKILSDNYVLSLKTEKGLERKSIYEINFDGKYFSNQDFSNENQFIFSTFENVFTIYIKKSNLEFYIEPLSKFDKTAAQNDYVFYETKDILSDTVECGNSKNEEKTFSNAQISNKNITSGGCKTIELAMSIDYNFYSTYGSVNASIDRTLQILNLTQANYTIGNGLANDFRFLVNEHYMVTCPASCNYWLPTLEIYNNHNSFGINANQMFTNPYDVKIHWQNEGGTGSVVGLGSLSMCGTTGIATVKNFVSDTNGTRCVLSHEIGHNLGCAHNSEIMAAILSYSNIWSTASINTLNNSFNTVSCLAVCNTSVCDSKKVTDLVVTADNANNSINVSWLAETGIDFKVRLYNTSTNSWSAYTTFTYPTNTTFFNFTPTYCLDNYKVEITPFCSTIKGITEQVVVQTNKTVASPTLIFNSSPLIPFCGSWNRSFTVTAIDGGTTPIYQWKKNGINVGTNSPTFSSNSFVNNDVLSCTLTSNATCVAATTTTVSATLNVITPTVLSNSIVASQSTICAGTSVTLIATGTNVTSANPYYSWFLNGQPYNTGQNSGSPILTTIPTNDGDVFTCVLYDGSGCHFIIPGGALGGEGATSNPITISILNPCTLSNSEFDKYEFSYYPNPVQNELIISQNNLISEVTFYSILGQKIFSKEVKSNKVNIDVSELTLGTYFVKIKSEENNRNIKIIKN